MNEAPTPTHAWALRETVNRVLFNPCTGIGRVVNGFFMLIVVLTVVALPLHFLPEKTPEVAKALLLFSRFAVTIFTFEYILRIWAAHRPIKYIFSWWGLVDLLAILPFYSFELGILHYSPELFVLSRICRILKIAKVFGLEQKAIERGCMAGHGEFRLHENERLEKVIQKHPLVFLSQALVCILFFSGGLALLIIFGVNTFTLTVSGVGFGFALVFFLKTWLDLNYTVIYITNRRVILQKHAFFGIISNDIAYEMITNAIPNESGFWRWILNIGDIILETAGRESNWRFRNVRAAHDVAHLISENRQEAFIAKEYHEEDHLAPEPPHEESEERKL